MIAVQGAPPIVTLTLNPAVDQICWVEAIEEDIKIRAREARFEPGGGGINVARALHQLGAEATALWSKGAEIGRLLHRLLDEEGLDHRPVPIEEATRINLAAFPDDGNGHELLFDMPGPELTAAEVEAWMDLVEDLDVEYTVLSGRRPPDGGDVYGRLAHRLKRRSKLVLDTSGPGLARTLEEGVFLVKPNLTELSQLTGTELATHADIESAARDIIEVGMAEIVVVSLGKQGAMAVDDEEAIHVDAPTVDAKSNVGAGDSMLAGLTCQLSAGIGLEHALRYGVAAGSDAARRPGTDLCTREGVAELLDRTSIRRHAP